MAAPVGSSGANATREPALEDLVAAVRAATGIHPLRLHLAGRGRAAPSATVRLPGGALRTLALRIGVDGAPQLCDVPPERDSALCAARLLASADRLAALARVPRDRIAGLELLSYRPGKRAVVRVRRTRGGPLFLKMFSPRGFAAAARVLSRLPARAGQVQLQLPEAMWAEEGAHLCRSAPGCSLHEQLAAGARVPAEGLAAGLDAFARAAPPPGGLPRRTLAHERDSAEKMLARGSAWLPELGALRRQVGALRLPLDPPARSLLHADLHDKQVFVRDGGIALIDLEGVSVGDVRIDRANLVEHCALREWQGMPGAGVLARELERRWQLCGDPLAALLRGLVRARLAGVYGQRPGAEPLARQLAAEAALQLREC